MIRFIDAHRERRSAGLRWGIEPICKVLQIAPSTFHVAKRRPSSARAVRNAELRPEILRVWEQNLSVYGADKVWDQLNKDGIRVARCSVERLMRDMGIQGARRGRTWVRTTTGDERLERPADLVERRFRAPALNRLWVADLTYVKTHAGWVYVAFIVDVFSRMIVGWQASRSLRADLAIDALEMAVHSLHRTQGGSDAPAAVALIDDLRGRHILDESGDPIALTADGTAPFPTPRRRDRGTHPNPVGWPQRRRSRRRVPRPLHHHPPCEPTAHPPQLTPAEGR